MDRGIHNSIYVHILSLSETGIKSLKTKSEIKLNLHVLFLKKKKKKNSEVQQRMDNHLVDNRFHEITNEIQTLHVSVSATLKNF